MKVSSSFMRVKYLTTVVNINWVSKSFEACVLTWLVYIRCVNILDLFRVCGIEIHKTVNCDVR